MMRRTKKWGKALWTTLPGAKQEETKKPKRIAQVSSRQRKRLSRYAALKAEWLRVFHSNGICDCGCWKKSDRLDVHHTRGRAGQLLLDWRHWRALRRECHDWVAAHPVEARRRGLLCEPGLWNVPDETPVPDLPARK